MNAAQFQMENEGLWQELAGLIQQFEAAKRGGLASGTRLVTVYRQVCEHLALARTRDYPDHLVDRLESLAATAHQHIYRRREWGLSRLLHFVRSGFPRSVRALRTQVLLACALFVVPTLLMGWLVFQRPEYIGALLKPMQVAEFEAMYGDDVQAFGREREVDTDLAMFGHYIRNNIGISFQCFAGGIFLGLGSVFFLIYNGLYGGAVGGYLTAKGLSDNFYSFIVTHGAFELTAIVLAGACGLRLGHALLAPQRRSRKDALAQAGRDTVPVMYGVILMLVTAAFIEAFWSSSVWMPDAVKYGVAALCWLGVLSYLLRAGTDRAD